jgi:phosphoserine phosphatase RsbU/P
MFRRFLDRFSGWLTVSFGLCVAAPLLASEIAPGGIVLSGHELLDQGMGAIFIASGLGAMLLFAMRAGRRSATLLLLGISSTLYGMRLADDSLFMAGVPLHVAAYIKPLITYFLPLTLFGYVWIAIGRRWRSLSAIAMLVQVVYCVTATILDLIHGPAYAMGPNNYLILTSMVVLVFDASMEARRRGVEFRRELRRSVPFRLTMFGIIVVTLFVLNENLMQSGLLPWRVSYEPLGMLILLACLGGALAHQLFTSEVEMAGVAHELATAQTIQQSILPASAPSRGDVSIAVRYRPAAAVGGDFYDFISGDDGAITLLIADVSGHGVPAALIASMMKVAFGAQRERAADPGVALTGVRAAMSTGTSRQSVTASCVSIGADGTIRYANAGHPPMLMRAGGVTTETAQSAPPIGAFRNVVYRGEPIELPRPARLLLYSDGVTEAANRNAEQFGEVRLRSALEHSDGRDAEQCADSIVSALESWSARASGEPFEDDVTIVVVDLSGLRTE